ncbi:MAG: PAS domain S-box protein [Acidobacteria bacterium]|nr:PAS domain S-box protein [Acidobacteriota bacterium]
MSVPRPLGARSPGRFWSESAPARYGLAVAAAAAATLAMFVLYAATGLQRGSVPFIFYFIAIIVVALYGGRGPGLLAILLSALAAHYFFLPPFDTFGLSFAALLQTGVFVLVSLLISALADRSARAEARAHADRESLQTTLRSIGDAVIATDGRGLVRFMNPVAERLTGWTLAEAEGRPLAEVFRIVNELTRETVESPVEKVLREGRVVGLANHTVLVARDGTEVPIEDSGAPIRDERGRTSGVVLVFHDVTEQRKVERARAFQAAIVESSSEAVIGKTLEGVITSWNEAAERMYGYAAEEAVGRHISLIVPEELREDLDDILARLGLGERVERAETVRVRRDGTRLDVSLIVSPVRDSSGRLVGASTIARDITAQKRADEERARLALLVGRERERLKNLVAHVPGVVWEAWGEPDASGQRMDFVSDYVEQMLGYTVEEWLRTPNFWLSIVHPEDHDRAAAEARAIFDGREGGTSQFRWMHRDGRAVHVESQSRVILDGEGRPVGMRGVTLDITERKATEERLRVLYERAQEVNRAKDEFLATLSHELRTPLTPVLGWTHMIRSGRLGAAEVAQGVRVIEKNSQSLARLINDLLDMSSILSGKMRIERGPVELSSVVREAAETVRPQADARSVKVEVSADGPHAPVVSGDRTRLVQVFWNLLHNAVKFSREGGRVRVRVGGRDGAARVEVEDEGSGIAPEFLPHVFERFRQADMASTRMHGGLGLGLALVKSFVEAHGGSVDVESAGEGLGSRFTVALPSADSDGARPDSGDLAVPEGEPCAERHCRVLLVEDAPDTLEMLKVVFEARGYTTSACATPEEALAVAESGRFDIIVSDIGLPRIDGYELISRLRELPHLRGVPALALTGYAAQKDAEAARAAGFDAHVPKPVDPAELAERMDQLTRRKDEG